MGATFPNGIAAFTTKKNMVDDVEAGDINKLQDEVVALEETLGDALTTLEILEEEVTDLASDLAEDDSSSKSRDNSLTVKYRTLKELINDLWWGKNIYVAQAVRTNFTLRKTPSTRPYPPNLIHLNKPSGADDPAAMWNGTGFTLKKSGFWVINGIVDINLAKVGPSSNQNFGTYEGSITFNSTDWVQGLDRQYPQVDETWHNVVLNPSFTGFLAKGTKISLRAAQSSALDQNVQRARLTVHMVRSR